MAWEEDVREEVDRGVNWYAVTKNCKANIEKRLTMKYKYHIILVFTCECLCAIQLEKYS